MTNSGQTPTQVVVAIDGPSGSGKSSVSKEIARRLDLGYLDTGAMYRAVTWWAMTEGTDWEDGGAVVVAAQEAPVEISTDPDRQFVQVGATDVTAAIRTPEVTSHVSAVATVPAAREVLVARQRQIIADSGRRIVAEGRDITTVVAPDAEVRILLVANEQARMNRRGAQLGGSQDAESLRAQVVGRDAKDSTVVNFSTAADGVITLDNSELNLEQTVQAVLDLIFRAVPDLA
ncbi:MAG: (d)CMP kinase [Kocuria sp.]|nr:(d)CMP kinase [Kocuria sp.]MDO5619456.1 (d)CMP kinase [Kocuria sp.]